MNEQIKALAQQAGFEEKDGHISIQGVYMFNTHRMEKFAELIVRECIVDFYRNYLDTTSDDDITEQVDRYVKQNFGVE
jgi:hypothetical protein